MLRLELEDKMKSDVKLGLHSGSTGCHNYFFKYIFFALYVSSHLGKKV
jgi:hypothetical protein